MNEWHKHYGGARPPSLKAGDQAECRLRGGGVVTVTVGTEPDELWHDYGGDFDVVKWRLVNAQPRPGDTLSEAQAMRWMSDNLDAGRGPGEGLEWWHPSGRWSDRPMSIVDVAVFARNNRLRVAPKQRTVNIDGAEYPVPEPMAEVPEIGRRYWFCKQGRILEQVWRGNGYDKEAWRLLAEGSAYTSLEEAEQALAIQRAIYSEED